jgi:hypothetical protein
MYFTFGFPLRLSPDTSDYVSYFNNLPLASDVLYGLKTGFPSNTDQICVLS